MCVVQIGVKIIELQGHRKACVELWDIPHTIHMSDSILSESTANAQAIVFVYNLLNPSSVDTMKHYYQAFQTPFRSLYGGTLAIPAIVLGNQLDRAEAQKMKSSAAIQLDTTKIVKMNALQWTSKISLPHYLVSAKKNTGISQALKDLLHILMSRRQL